MANRSKNMKNNVAVTECDQIHRKLLREAIKGLADLKSGKTLSLSQTKSRTRAKRLSSEQRLIQALRPLKGILKGDTRAWPYR